MRKNIILLFILLTSTISYAEFIGQDARSIAHNIISKGGDLYAQASDKKKDLNYTGLLPCHADLHVTPQGTATIVLKDTSCGDMNISASEVIQALLMASDKSVSVSCDKQTCKIRYNFIPDYYRIIPNDYQKVDFNALKDSTSDVFENEPVAFIKQYIKTRFEIGNDISELEQRWSINGKLDKMTSAPTYHNFLNNEKYGFGLIQRAKEEKLIRKVEINDLKYNSDRGYWIIDVSFFDTDVKNTTPIKTDWLISMDLKENFLNTTNPKKYPRFRVNNFGQRKK